jgi:hypothetical protein
MFSQMPAGLVCRNPRDETVHSSNGVGEGFFGGVWTSENHLLDIRLADRLPPGLAAKGAKLMNRKCWLRRGYGYGFAIHCK